MPLNLHSGKILLSVILITGTSLFGQLNSIRPDFELMSSSANFNFTQPYYYRNPPLTLELSFDFNKQITGPMQIISTDQQPLFTAILKNGNLTDSAVWYNKGQIEKIIHFSDTCCNIKGSRQDLFGIYSLFIPGIKQGRELKMDHENPDQRIHLFNYYQGRLSGKQYYYKEGILKNIITYKSSIKNDTSWIGMDRPQPDIEIYENGKPVGVWKYFNEEGIMLQEHHYLPTLDSLVYFDLERNISLIITKSNRGSQFRNVIEYNSSNRIIKKYHLFNDQFNDQYVEYDSKGRKVKVASYSQGVLNGPYEEYEKGKLIEKGNYTYGKKSGYWTTYSPYGGIIDHENYGTFKTTVDPPEEDPVMAVQEVFDIMAYNFTDQYTEWDIKFYNEKYGKINRLLKKYDSITFQVVVLGIDNYTIQINDERLKKKHKEYLIEFLQSSIQVRQPVKLYDEIGTLYCSYTIKLNEKLK